MELKKGDRSRPTNNMNENNSKPLGGEAMKLEYLTGVEAPTALCSNIIYIKGQIMNQELKHEIIQGDSLEVMKTMADNSIDFIVTDPPYGLKFMGKDWDHGIPNISYWMQALRICKPGSMLAAFGGTRTFHRLMCLLEDARWEIRDVICWLYGQGFPKSHNNFGLEGYGTALKPAWEPIILAMKPLDGTYAQNVQKWGLGGINIDESRIETIPRNTHTDGNHRGPQANCYGKYERIILPPATKGRWPANLILNEEVAEQLDFFTGISKSAKGKCNAIKVNPILHESKGLHTPGRKQEWEGYGDSGGASRYFYCAKASPAERQGSTHPTVKPISLMKYILKLLAPPGSPLCLDPFAGSGTTVIAAKELGISCIGIEKEEGYVNIARKRLDLSCKK